MRPDTVVIDGSQGEGGGQIVRSSLALSMVTGRSLVIENIRAGRKKPGLLRQHLTAVKAAAQIALANVEGDELGSSRIAFEPGEVCGGSYSFQIGSAGSTTLVLQTILPALFIAREPSTVIIEGGTHNPMAPPFDFLSQAYLPLVNRTGPDIELELDRYGFYPGGGGRIRASIAPAERLAPIRLTDRDKPSSYRARAIVAHLPENIGERQVRAITRKLNWGSQAGSVDLTRESNGPGNVVYAEIQRSGFTEIFTGFGVRGEPAEKVAYGVVRQVRRYIKSTVPVGPFLADQLLLPLGIGAHQGSGGGEFDTLDLSEHSLTHIEVLKRFLDIEIHVETNGRDNVRIRVEPNHQ